MDVRDRARGLWSGTRGRPITRAILVLLSLVAIAAVIWLAIWLTHRDTGGPGGGRGGFGGRGGRPSTTVGVATVQLASIPITLDGLGTVTPAATVTVTPQVSGVITQILFREGQVVRAGQALAVIDPRPLRNALTQAEGQLTRDEAQLANARLLLQRDRTLLAQDSIARQDVDTQAALVRQLEGTVRTDQGAVAQARLNLGFSRVTAPVSGRVGLRVVDVGNFISAGASTGLVVITQVTPIDVEFTVPQDDVPRIQTQAAQGVLPAVAYDRTRTVELDRGAFSTLDNQIDTTTGTVRAKARFPNGRGTLFPNQFVNVRLQLQTLNDVVTVPVTAVRTGSDGDFVWKLNEDHTVTRRKITRGPSTAEVASVTAGLTAGEQVITEGGDRLTEGARVTLPGERPRAPAGGAQASRAGRAAMRQACQADMQKLCAGETGRAAFTCLRAKAAQASAPCQAAMAKAGGGRGPAGAGPANQAGAARNAPSGGTAAPTPSAGVRAPPAAAPAPQASAQGQGGEPGSRRGGGQGGGQGGGGFQRSPEMQAARQAMMQACGSDMRKLCAGQEGREAFMCLRENVAKASPACQAALAKMPRRQRPAAE